MFYFFTNTEKQTSHGVVSYHPYEKNINHIENGKRQDA